MTSVQGPSGLFVLATAPARLASRFRPALAESLASDAATFAGSRQAVFAILTLLAIGYPLVASAIHALIGPQPESERIISAITPTFEFLYIESLPFMIVTVGIGLLSPALGVLLVTVFVPADLIATAIAQNNQFQPPETATAGRLVSDAILWILAVEVPLLTRRWVSAWQASRPSAPSATTIGVAYAIAAAIPTFIWTHAALWLVQPAWNWTSAGGPGGFLPWRMAATWWYGWILVLGAVAFAFVAGALQRPTLGASTHTPTRAPGVGGELIRVALLGVLLSGLMWGWLETIMILAGLVVTGPVLTRVLPRIPAPAPLADARPAVRWAAAMILAGLVTWVAVTVIPLGTLPMLPPGADYLVLTALFAVLAPLVRIIVEVGASAEEAPAVAAST